MNNRRFPGGGLPRDAAVDTDGKGDVGGPWPYSNQFEHDEGEGVDEPLGRDVNDGGASKVYPDWWKNT